ncbi:hypothetical protein [Sansalvadorimonas verongulae]|uniref:hypothetical protein n=1 Tax=Sansalvadorimonas verongulae TaxID=2172824 RepID=UPI0012BCDC35|nr:hypothetical protein [Sansalvadorimonas verongulae]
MAEIDPETIAARNYLMAVGLCLLSPLIAEYLLGDWTLQQLLSLLFLVPLYGAGALAVREIARHCGLGEAHKLCICLSGLVMYSILGLYQFSKGQTGLGFQVSYVDLGL